MRSTRRTVLRGLAATAAITGTVVTSDAAAGESRQPRPTRSRPASSGHPWERPHGEEDGRQLAIDRTRVYDRNEIDAFAAVVGLPVGGAVLAGSTVAYYGRNAWFVRVDPDGGVRYNETVGRDRPEPVFDAALDPSGDVVAAGTSVRSRSNVESLFLRVSPTGEPVVRRTYGQRHSEATSALVPLGTGNYALVGQRREPAENRTDGLVRVVAPDGSPVRQQPVGVGERAALTAATPTADGGCLAAGWARQAGETARQLLVARCGPDGRVGRYVVYDRRLRTVGDVVQLPDGEVVVGGTTRGSVPGGLFVRLDGDGVRWTAERGGDASAQVSALAVRRGSVAFGGLRDGPSSSAWVGVLDEDGVGWDARIGGRYLTDVRALAATGRGLLAVGNTRFDSDGQDGYLLWLGERNRSPTATFAVTPSNPRVGQRTEFDGTASTDPDGRIVAHEWDFTGDGTVDATGPSVMQTFTRAGRYPVRLRVTDDGGRSAVARRRVTVVDPDEAADGDSDQKTTSADAPGLGLGMAALSTAAAAAVHRYRE